MGFQKYQNLLYQNFYMQDINIGYSEKEYCDRYLSITLGSRNHGKRMSLHSRRKQYLGRFKKKSTVIY